MPTKPEIAASKEEVDDIYSGSTEDTLPPELQKIVDAPAGEQPAGDQPAGEEPAGDEQPAGDEGEQSEGSEGSEGAAEGQKDGGEAEGTEGAAAPVKDRILTAEEIRSIAAEEREEFLRQQEANKPAPQLTAEEIKKLLNPVEVSAEEVADLLGIPVEEVTEKKIKALESILNKPVRNATSLANLMNEQKLRKLEQTFAPMQAQHAEAQIKETRNAFHTRHPAMKKYDELVAVATQQVSPIKANGKQKSRDEIFDDVAAHVSNILVKSGVKIEAKPTVNQVPAKGNAVPKMAARQQPGRSVGSQSKGKQNNPDDDIYEG